MNRSIRLPIALLALSACFPGTPPAALGQATPAPTHYIPAPPVGMQPGAQLGSAVATDGNLTVTGAPSDDLLAQDSGVVKVFDSTTGALLHLLPNPTPARYDGFGSSVAISGPRVVVGAFDDVPGTNLVGIAYVYDLASTTPTIPVMALTTPRRVSGQSVAISGTRVVVGAPSDYTGATNAGSAYVYDLAGATPNTPVATLNNPSPAANDQFGNSVAISGTRVVVGASQDDTGATNAGSAYVYDLASATPTTPVATLTNPSLATVKSFGFSVAISGTRVAVGASQILYAGAAYVYDLAGANPTTPMATLTDPSPGFNNNFGKSVAISGTRALVGGYGNGSDRAYLYDVVSATPTTPFATLTEPSPAAGNGFGVSVAISGTSVVVGAPRDDMGATDAGSAYVYDLAGAAPTTAVAKLNNPGPAAADFFGTSVAISGTRMVVGATREDTGAQDAGSAYVYDLASTTPTTPVATLHNPSPGTGDFFGCSVGISGTRVVVGALRDDTGPQDVGIAYVYDLASATPTTPVATLNNPSPSLSDLFGQSVAISGTLVVVGAPDDDTGLLNAGSAYVYDLASATPTTPVATLNNPEPTVEDQFGNSVAVDGTRIVVGAYLDDAGADAAGSAYVYDLSSATPTVPVATLHNPSPGSSDLFGFSVAISGPRVVVGALYDSTNVARAGSAYVYDLASATPTVPVATLNNPDPATDDAFGVSVAISGTRVVVGASSDDTGATDSGTAYVYDLAGATPTVPVATLNNPGPSASDSFGRSVAVDGTTAVAGIPGDDSPQNDKGSVAVFSLVFPTPLETTLTTTEPNPTNDPTGDFAFMSNEAGATFEVQVDAGAYAAATSPYSTAPLADGSHTLRVRALSAGGMADPSPASYTWRVDTVAPETTITSGPSGTVDSAEASFYYSADEAATFTYSLDGATPVTNPGKVTFYGLAQGTPRLASSQRMRRAMRTRGRRREPGRCCSIRRRQCSFKRVRRCRARGRIRGSQRARSLRPLGCRRSMTRAGWPSSPSGRRPRTGRFRRSRARGCLA